MIRDASEGGSESRGDEPSSQSTSGSSASASSSEEDKSTKSGPEVNKTGTNNKTMSQGQEKELMNELSKMGYGVMSLPEMTKRCVKITRETIFKFMKFPPPPDKMHKLRDSVASLTNTKQELLGKDGVWMKAWNKSVANECRRAIGSKRAEAAVNIRRAFMSKFCCIKVFFQ